MFPFRVYTDSDTFIQFSFERNATAYFNRLVSEGKLAMIVEISANTYVCQTPWFEGEQAYTESQFLKLLQSL